MQNSWLLALIAGILVMSGCEVVMNAREVQVATDETHQLQAEIDRVSAAGGGKVTIGAGRHLVGQLDLRSNVELHLEKGAVLEGRFGLENYRMTELPYSEGTWAAVVFAVGVTNVAITGEGEIFGNGIKWPQTPPKYLGIHEGTRPRGVFFADSRNIRLEDFTLRDSGSWGIVFKCCYGVVARRVKVDNHGCTNNDGFDVEAANVIIEDCDIDSEDDALCVKSNNPKFTVENVIFRNCIARSHCNICKIGTATRGTVRNVRYENIKCEAPRRDFLDNRKVSKRFGKPFFGERVTERYPYGVGLSMVAIENVDGGRVEDITVDGLTGDGCMVPLFVRAGERKSLNRLPPGDQYVFRGVTLKNIDVESASTTANSISGVDRLWVEDVRLENVRVVCCGAGEVESKKAMEMPVPDVSGKYPECTMFRPSILPAFGLYVDRVRGLELVNAEFVLKEGTTDARLPIFNTAR